MTIGKSNSAFEPTAGSHSLADDSGDHYTTDGWNALLGGYASCASRLQGVLSSVRLPHNDL